MLDIASGSNTTSSERLTANLSPAKRWNGNSDTNHKVDEEHFHLEAAEGYPDIAEPSSSASSSLGVLFRETKGQISTLFGNISQWLGGSSSNSATISSYMVAETKAASKYTENSPLDSALLSLDSVTDDTTIDAPSHSAMSTNQNHSGNNNAFSNNAKMGSKSDDVETPVDNPVTAAVTPHNKYFHSEQVGDTRLELLTRYSNSQLIGSGAQGVVVSAYDSVIKRKVAIKKLTNPFVNATHAKRAFRELVLLKTVNHVNVIRLYNCYTPQDQLKDFKDIYLVTEFMNANLTQVIRMQVDHERISFLLYQMLCGINHLHKAGIIHRDLKPSNIVVNNACKLKILDFGLARNTKERATMTPYVVTRYYRAPEVILGAGYSNNVDVWSIGCIFAELILGRVLFPGSDHVHQWTKILELMGTPSTDFVSRLTGTVRTYVEKCPLMPAKPWEEILPDSAFPQMNPELPVLCPNNARDLLSRMLVIDPLTRISVTDALQHFYVKLWYEKEEAEAPAAKCYDDTVEQEDDIEAWRKKIFDVLEEFKNNNDIYGKTGQDRDFELKEHTEKMEEDRKEEMRKEAEFGEKTQQEDANSTSTQMEDMSEELMSVE